MLSFAGSIVVFGIEFDVVRMLVKIFFSCWILCLFGGRVST